MSVRSWPLIILMVGAGHAVSDPIDRRGYYHGKEEGWFWREVQPEASADGAESSPVPPPARKEEDPSSEFADPAPLSPQWLREKLPEFRDRALEAPTPENVRAYFYLQRHAMNMAEQFAHVAQKVVMADPLLDENTRRPLSTYGAQVFDEVAREQTLKVATKIAGMAGLWYFYRSDCPYCGAQNPVLDRLRRRLGLAVLPIALDRRPMPDTTFPQYVPDRGHAARLGVTRTPTLFLVREPDEFILLSEGLVTDDGLLERMIRSAHEVGWITEREFDATRATRPAERTIAAQDLDPVAIDDPVTLVELLRARERVDGPQSAH